MASETIATSAATGLRRGLMLPLLLLIAWEIGSHSGLKVLCELDAGHAGHLHVLVVTTSLKIHFLRPVSSGKLTANEPTIQKGRAIVVVGPIDAHSEGVNPLGRLALVAELNSGHLTPATGARHQNRKIIFEKAEFLTSTSRANECFAEESPLVLC